VSPSPPGNIHVLDPHRPYRTHCLDCDPDAARPFRIPVHADRRTGDILTPCPACGRYALVVFTRAAGRRSLGTR
jgi:hypothetical protein